MIDDSTVVVSDEEVESDVATPDTVDDLDADTIDDLEDEFSTN